MPQWLHKFCIAVLTLALLTAPCLSVLGVVTAGHAHAGHAMHGPVSAADHHHAGHAAKQDNSAHHAHAMNGGASDQGTDPALRECCRLCLGWVSKSGKDILPALQSTTASWEQVSKLPAALVPSEPLTPGSGMLRIGVLPLLQAGSASASLYALTGRRRL